MDKLRKTPKKRRIQHKTDYKKRMNLLKSNKPRLIFRKTNKYLISQYIESDEAKDKVIFTINSKKLLKHGWPEEMKGSLKSIPASYLTGFLAGKRIISEKIEKPIIDIGMTRIIKKTKVFAFIKGIIDSGIKIESDSEKFPKEEKIKGKNLKKDFSAEFEKIKSKIEKT